MFRRLFYFLSYFGKPPWDSGVSPPELMEFIQSHPPGRALDLGCGTGTNAITLAQHGWSVTGVDFMSKAIQQAKKKAQQAGFQIHLLVGDVTRLEKLIGSFDLILDIGCFHNLSPLAKQAYRENLSRWLAPGGKFLLYGFLITDPEANLGISGADIAGLSTMLTLTSRTDSTGRGRPATWILFRSPRGDNEKV
jgi:SAM-dependent methyltransferase